MELIGRTTLISEMDSIWIDYYHHTKKRTNLYLKRR